MKIDERIIESIKNSLRESGQTHLENEFIKLINNFVDDNCQLPDDMINIIEGIKVSEELQEEEHEN